MESFRSVLSERQRKRITCRLVVGAFRSHISYIHWNYARGLEARDRAIPRAGRLTLRYTWSLFQAEPRLPLFKSPPSVRSFHSKYDRRVPEMKAKVICGGRPAIREKQTRTRINPWRGNSGVVVGPGRRRRSLILAALQLLARKIRAKEWRYQSDCVWRLRTVSIQFHRFSFTGITALHRQSSRIASSLNAKFLPEEKLSPGPSLHRAAEPASSFA